MKSFQELAKERYSCRSYSSKEVSKDIISEVLNIARMAPSAKNLQPWRFVVVTNADLKEKLSDCYSASWLKTAPVIIVACGDHSASWKRSDGKDHCDIDLAIAIDHITLSATDIGLATCWICKFDVMKCAEVLNLPSNVYPVALIPLGYSAEKGNYSERHLIRKDLGDIVSWEGYNF
jgi:nitroreductase